MKRLKHRIAFGAIILFAGYILLMPVLVAQEPSEKTDKSAAPSSATLKVVTQSQTNARTGNSIPQFQSAREANRYFDQLKIQALADYVRSGERPDVESAYMIMFNAVIEHDLFVEFEKEAERYLKNRPDGSVTPLARAITSMALASRNEFQRSAKIYAELLSEIGPQNIGFAWTFGDSLARLAMTSGEYAAARQIYEVIGKKFPDEAEINGQVEAQLTRIDLVGKPAPAFSATDIDGKKVALDDYRNKVTLLDFWATWCRPCVAELPAVLTIYDKFHARGFEVIGISLDENPDAVREFLKENKLPWRQVVNGSEKEQNIVVMFGVDKIPATFLLDGTGKIQRIDLRGENLEKAVESLLIKTAAKPEGDRR